MNCTTLVDTMIALPLLSKIVYVNCTNIGNLHELKNLPTLNTLVLDNCEVKDYTFVENLTTVENLTISTEDVVKLPPSVKMYNGKKVEEVS
jgi:Leucine-rich repeat (LRR) protein